MRVGKAGNLTREYWGKGRNIYLYEDINRFLIEDINFIIIYNIYVCHAWRQTR